MIDKNTFKKREKIKDNGAMWYLLVQHIKPEDLNDRRLEETYCLLIEYLDRVYWRGYEHGVMVGNENKNGK